MNIPLIIYEMTKTSTTIARSLVNRKIFSYNEIDFFTQVPYFSDTAINSVHNK